MISRTDHVELRQKVKQLMSDNGFTVAKAAVELGVSERAIYRHMVALGIPRQTRRVLTDDEMRQIELFIEDECPFNEIARTLGVSAKMIQTRFRGQGSGENLVNCRQLRAKLGLTWTTKMIGEP